MPNQRKCIVTFRDRRGVEHLVEVVAGSLYEAGTLALKQFRRHDWSREDSLEAGTLRVEVRESAFYQLKVTDLESWLNRSGGSPREVSLRGSIRQRLQPT